MSTVVSAITGCRNRGVEALVRSILLGFSEHGVESGNVTILSSDPVYDKKVLSGSADVIEDCASYFMSNRISRLKAAASRLKPSIYPAFHRLESAVKNADLLIASGGDVYGSDYGTTFLKRMIEPVELAQQQGVKTALLAQSIGPFGTEEDAAVWLKMARKLDLLTVRESRTYEYVVDRLGIDEKQVVLTADPAFLLPHPSANRIEALQRGIGLPAGASYVCLAPSAGISTFAGIDPDIHAARWIKLIKSIHDASGMQVVLIPHVHDCRPHNDDRQFVTHLLDELNYPPYVHAPMGEYSSIDFKGIISRSELLIGERMHACIAALSSAVCTIAVSYSVKAGGVLGDIFEKMGNEDSFVISVKDFVFSDTAEKSILDMLDRRASVSEQLKTVLPWLKQGAAENFVQLRKLREQ